MKIAFLGGGNMAGALIGGLLAKGYAADSISVIELFAQARDNLSARYKVHVSESPDAHTFAADTLVSQSSRRTCARRSRRFRAS